MQRNKASPPLACDQTAPLLDGFVTDVQLADQLGMKPAAIRRGNLARAGMPSVKVGRRRFYSVAAVREWLLKRASAGAGQ